MTVLETERLLLREHRAEDLEAYVAMEADPDVRRYVGGSPRTREGAEKRFREGLADALSPLSLRAVINKPEGIYIGRAGLYPHFGMKGPIDGEASLSFYLSPAYWGQGLATEAAEAFVRHGFETLGLNKILATIDAGNAASRRVLAKLGFTHVGTERGRRTFENYELLHPDIPRE